MVLDPGNALSVASLVWDVAKDLYWYYKTYTERDEEINALQSQLLWLSAAAKAIDGALKSPDLPSEATDQVETSLSNCRDAVGNLQSILNDFKTNRSDSRTTFDRFTAHGRNVLYPFRKATIQRLAGHVQTCQRFLQLAVVTLHLDIGISSIEQIRALDETVTSSFAHIETSRQTAEDERRAKAIVESLGRIELDRRREEVALSYHNTFDWILQENEVDSLETLSQHAAKNISERSRITFASWLQHEHGIFWISGKAGSGKSTLMKFLAEHERTEQMLTTWAGNEPLSMANHFFWLSGANVQQSHLGMLQNILRQLLEADLSLVPVACSRRWMSSKPSSSAWTMREVSASVQTVIDRHCGRICLFIDGLDELQPESEHRNLIEWLVKLGDSEKVKIVVASRPWEIFEDAFGHSVTKLRLEEVNRQDILDYIFTRMTKECPKQMPQELNWSNLNFHRYNDLSKGIESDNRDILKLGQDICLRSEGVFLWVSLVLDVVCQRLSAGQAIAQVREYVDAFPPELEDYFRDLIMKRIHGTWVSDTAMALKIMQIVQQRRHWWKGDTLLVFWLLTPANPVKLIDPEFVFKTNTSLIDGSQMEIMAKQTREFLSFIVRDLLVVKSTTYRDSRRLYTVSYIHRTVHDFLQSSEMFDLIHQHVPAHFQEEYFVSYLTLAWLKMVPPDDDEGRASARCVQAIAECLLPFRLLLSTYMYDGYHLYEHLTSDERNRSYLDRMPKRLADELESIAVPYICRMSEGRSRFDNMTESGTVKLLACLTYFKRSTLISHILSVQPGLVCYNTRTGLNLLSVALRFETHRECDDFGIDLELVRMLLDHGADPNQVVESSENERTNTIWVFYVTHVAHSWIEGVECSCLIDEFNGRPAEKHYQQSWEVIRHLIEAGADLNATVGLCDGLCGCGVRLPNNSGQKLMAAEFLSAHLPSALAAELQLMCKEYRQQQFQDSVEQVRASTMATLPSILLSPSHASRLERYQSDEVSSPPVQKNYARLLMNEHVPVQGTRFWCDICESIIPSGAMAYNCARCEVWDAVGNFDMCQNCFQSGDRCADNRHELVRVIISSEGRELYRDDSPTQLLSELEVEEMVA